MCGIAGIYVKNPHVGQIELDRFADGLFQGIERRGKDATGYLAVKNDNSYEVCKNNVPASDFIRTRPYIPDNTKMLLMHTRYATQGRPEDMENNHPVLYDTCFVTHNGVIYNDDNVFAELACTRPAEVDSVAIPAALIYHGMGNVADIKTALEQVQGAMAIAAADPIKHPGRLLLAKGSSSPLYIINTRHMLVWASSMEYILEAWATSFGTPPSREGTKENNFTGRYEFKYGDLMILEDDNILHDTFTPRYGGRPAQGRTFPNSDSYDDYYTEDWYGTNRKWTCVDATGATNFSNCIHPCDPGCKGTQCWCYEGSLRHPKLPEVSGNGTARNLLLLRDSRSGGVAASEGPRSRCGNGVARTDCPGCFFVNCPNNLLDKETSPTITTDDGDVFTDCDSCGTPTMMSDLEDAYYMQVQFLLCHSCFNDPTLMKQLELDDDPAEEPTLDEQFEIAVYKDGKTVQSDAEGKATEQYESIAHEENLVHQRALLEVAYECDATVAFVDWILFRCPLQALEDDAHLARVREEIEQEYDNALRISRVLVEEAKVNERLH